MGWTGNSTANWEMGYFKTIPGNGWEMGRVKMGEHWIIYSIFSRGNVRQLWKLWGARLKLVKIKTFPLACRFIEFRTKSRFNYSIYWLKIWYWSKRWLKLKFALHQLQVRIRETLQSYSWIQHCDLGRSEQPSDLQLRSGFQWDLGFNHLLLQYHIFNQ